MQHSPGESSQHPKENQRDKRMVDRIESESLQLRVDRIGGDIDAFYSPHFLTSPAESQILELEGSDKEIS
jgi:hypothetical protein